MKSGKWLLIVFVVGLISTVFVTNYIRKQNREKYGVKGLCKVVDISTRTRGSKNTSVTESTVEFFIEGKKYIKVRGVTESMKIGDCYEMIYSSENPDNMEVNFDKKVPCKK